MPTLNVNSAVNTVTSTTFLTSLVLIAAGTIIGQMWTGWARDNLVDISVTGADALYALGGGVVVLALPVPRNMARPIAYGMGVSGVLTAGRELGVA